MSTTKSWLKFPTDKSPSLLTFGAFRRDLLMGDVLILTNAGLTERSCTTVVVFDGVKYSTSLDFADLFKWAAVLVTVVCRSSSRSSTAKVKVLFSKYFAICIRIILYMSDGLPKPLSILPLMLAGDSGRLGCKVLTTFDAEYSSRLVVDIL